MGKIYFNGVELTETYGMEILGRGTYGAPARDIEQVHVPGRNGDLLFDNGGYTNYELVYPECCIAENFPVYGAQLRNFLLSDPGYHQLIDTYDLHHYRMAEFRGPFLPDVHTARGNDSAVFDLSFNAKPMRYQRETYYGTRLYTASSSGYFDYTEAVLPQSADGHYAVRCVNSGGTSKTVYVYKMRDPWASGTEAVMGSASVPGNGEATVYVDADAADVLYARISCYAGNNVKVYCNGTQVYGFSGGASVQTVTVYNPYNFPAKPLLEIFDFTGTISVNGDIFETTYRTSGPKIHADSDMHIVYFDNGNPVSGCEGVFPVLKPGANTITVTADTYEGGSYVSMQPRFCTL